MLNSPEFRILSPGLRGMKANTMKANCILALGLVFVSGCMATRGVDNRESLVVTLCGADLGTLRPLDVREIAIDDFPSLKECPESYGISPKVSRDTMVSESSSRGEGLPATSAEGNGMWLAPKHVSYSVWRDATGQFWLSVDLWKKGMSCVEASRDRPLKMREGEAGTVLIPEGRAPKYVVCFVISRK